MDLNLSKSIINKYNTDSNGNPISVSKEERQQIHTLKNLIQTEGIIDEYKRIQILDRDMVEVFNMDDIKSANQYYVDYVNGVMHFHPDVKGQSIKFEYGNLGIELYGANRIFTKQDADGNAVEVLQDIIDEGREAIELIKTLGDAVVIIRKLEASVAEGKKILVDLENKKVEVVETVTNTSNECIDNVNEAIQQAKDEVIDVAGNEVKYITSNQWALNSTSKMYEYTLTHQQNSKALTINCYNSDTNDFVFTGGRILDKNRILFELEAAINLTVVINSRYYKPQMTLNSEIQEEVIEARKSEVDLKTKITKMDKNTDDLNAKVNTEVARIDSSLETIAIRNENIINITSFKNDDGSFVGVGNDDTTGFQKACDLGGVYFLPLKEYNLNRLNITKSVKFIGEKGCIINFSKSNTGSTLPRFKFNEISLIDNFTIENVEFKHTDNDRLAPIFLVYAKSFEIRNCVINSKGSLMNTYIWLRQIDNYAIIENNTTSIISDTNSIEGGTIWIQSYNKTDNIKNVTIRNNTFTQSNFDECIAIWDNKIIGNDSSIENVLISNNVFYSTDRADKKGVSYIAIYGDFRKQVLISENIFNLNNDYRNVIEIRSNSYNTDVSIKGNVFKFKTNSDYNIINLNNAESGYVITLPKHVLIEGNSFDFSANSNNITALLVTASAHDYNIIFSNNTVKNAQRLAQLQGSVKNVNIDFTNNLLQNIRYCLLSGSSYNNKICMLSNKLIYDTTFTYTDIRFVDVNASDSLLGDGAILICERNILNFVSVNATIDVFKFYTYGHFFLRNNNITGVINLFTRPYDTKCPEFIFEGNIINGTINFSNIGISNIVATITNFKDNIVNGTNTSFNTVNPFGTTVNIYKYMNIGSVVYNINETTILGWRKTTTGGQTLTIV